METKKYTFLFTLADGTTHSVPIDIPVGKNGGYYLPKISQISGTEIEIEFIPSETDMPSVEPVLLKIKNSGGNADLTGYATEQWVQDKYQPKGDYMKSTELQTAVDTALAQAKESGEFDGEDGEDGKTPVKGTDYYTEADKTEMVNRVLSALPTWTGGSY